MLLTSFTKQLINIYSINQFTSFPLSLHHTHKVTSLPSLRGRGKGERLFLKNHNTMKNSNKETLKTVLQFIVSVITALLATLGVQSCVCN